MSVYKKINELRKKVDDSQSGAGKKFLILKDKDAFRIRFLQELAEDGTHYSDKRKTAEVVNVHKSPLDFKKKVVCTAADGECWACEQVVTDNSWRPQAHLLVNVAVRDDNGNWEVRLLDQGFNQRHIGDTLVEYALEYKTIMEHDFKIQRAGSKMHDTNYTIIPVGISEEPESLGDVELFDLSTVFRSLPSAEQEEYLTSLDDEREPARSGASANNW